MAVAATELALALGRGEDVPQVGLEIVTTLTVRESTAPPKSWGARGRNPGCRRGTRGWVGRTQAAVPVTEPPFFVTRYVTVAPLQKWKVRVACAPSRRALR